MPSKRTTIRRCCDVCLLGVLLLGIRKTYVKSWESSRNTNYTHAVWSLQFVYILEIKTVSVWTLNNLRFCKFMIRASQNKVFNKNLYVTQQTQNVKMTSYQRRCDVITSHQRWYDVILTLCAYWECFVLVPRKYFTDFLKSELGHCSSHMPYSRISCSDLHYIALNSSKNDFQIFTDITTSCN